VVDDIQIDDERVQQYAETLIIDLFLISYKMEPREFKLNTFASPVVDEKGQLHLYTTLTMGRVMTRIEDRMNYLHYLLEEDEPVSFQVKIANWKGGRPQKLLLDFEDSEEIGKFITETVGL